MELLRFAFIGVGVGAIYALAAHGIVLVYRGSGILNFAHGAIALVAAHAFVELRADQPTPVAVGAGLAVAGAVGALVQVLVMRPLRAASPLARLIATLAVLTILQQTVVIRYGATAPFIAPILPTDSYTLIDGLVVGADRFWLLGIAVAVTAGLWVVYRFTSFGRATTAVAENELATASLGRSPDLIATVNWVAGAVLAGTAGILLAPITNLNAVALTLIVLPALAAALVGGFSSFPLTLVGGLIVGVSESVMQRYVSTPGWSATAPFLVIIAVLVLRGQALPLRGHMADRLPRLGTGRVSPPMVLAAGLVGAALSLTGSATLADAVTTTFLSALVVLSVVVVTGYAGQLSLAQFALAGMGALFSSRAADGWGWPFPAAAAFGVLATVPIGLLFAVPALRTRGVNLAIATLGLGLAIDKLVLANARFTGGPIRGTVVEPPSLFGWSIDSTAHPGRYAAVTVVAFVVAGLAVANLRRGRAGRRLVAVRANERAAVSLGIGVVGAKLYAFGVGAALAASAGVLFAFRYEHVQFGGYHVLVSINAVVLAVIGGIGFVPGAVLGAMLAPGGLAQFVADHITDAGRYLGLVAGVVLLLTLLTSPDGIAGTVDRLRRSRRAKTRHRPVVRTSPARVPPASLAVADLRVRFGAVEAVAGASFRVEPGEIVGLIGPNGAGKTTIIDAITGMQRGYGGSVALRGRPLERASASRRARAGIGRSFQSLELFEDMTVLDNLRAATDRRDGWAYLSTLVWPRQDPLPPLAAAAVEEFALADELESRPSELSYSHRHLVALARAVAGGPSVLLLDEPTAGLDQVETAHIGELIRRLAGEWGMAILLVEHDVELVMDVCDRVVALDFGQVIGQGTPTEIRAHAAVRAAYLGEDQPDDDDTACLVPSGAR